MARTDPQFNLRMKQQLSDRLAAAAEANKRSVTAEINDRLEKSFALDQLDPAAGATSLCDIDLKLSALCRHLGVKTISKSVA